MRFISFIAAILVFWANAGHAQSEGTARAVAAAKDYRATHEKEILQDFIDLLSIPNVADSLRDMRRNADQITGLLQERGFATEIVEAAGGAPYIFAELKASDATETVMLYAHFDGQPVQEENWAYPPFEPTLLSGRLENGGKPVHLDDVEGPLDPDWHIYARSAGDDKAPVILLIHALDALEEADIPLSVNIKLLLDGEEEQGSPTLGPVLEKLGDKLKSDLMLFGDGPMHQSRRAQLVFGVRGAFGVDLTTYGPARPLHSGHYGNWAPNPVMKMAYFLTSLRAENGRILIDGYYDDVRRLTANEQAAVAAMPDLTAALKDELAVHTPEGGGTTLEELVTLPALNVRGFVAGGVGDKGRNIILTTATASLDLRLVPDQQPDRVRELLEAHAKKQGYTIIHDDPTPDILRNHEKVMKFDWHPGYGALRTPMDDAMAQRLAALMRDVAPDLIMTPNMGGSLPLYLFAEAAEGTPIIILPIANHDNNQHAENENMRIRNLWEGIAAYAAVFANLGHY